MSIAVLNQVFDETRRLVIAGSHLAVGDFRLKKLVAPLRKSGKKAPVFAKVADAVGKLVDGAEKDSPQALLDLSSLVLAILYTQGETGVKGTVKPIESVDFGISTTQVSSRVLKPLLEALTTKGSGRFETVREAYERGAFNDLRLINPAIEALDDNYPDLADYMADTVLPKFGAAIVPAIKDRIDIKGRAGNVRRLRLLYQLDPKTARPIVEDAFENGSKEMKIAALGCLGDSKEDLPHLLEQATARSKDVRRIAMDRLAPFKGAEVEAIFEKAMQGADAGLVVAPLTKTKNTKLVKYAISQTDTCLNELLATKDKKKITKLANQLISLISCFGTRTDKPSVSLLSKLLDQWESVYTKPDGATIVAALSDVILSTGNRKLMSVLGTIHDSLADDDEAFGAAAFAALVTMSAKKAFDELHSHYLAAIKSKRKRRADKGETIRSMLCRDWYQYSYHPAMYHDNGHLYQRESLEGIKWDPRWLQLALEYGDTEVVCSLAAAKDKAATDYLVGFVRAKNSKRDYWDMYQAIHKLVELKHKEATDLVLEIITKSAKQKSSGYSWYGAHYAFPLISDLPKSSAKKIEASLPELPDSYIDQIMPHLLKLKQKTK